MGWEGEKKAQDEARRARAEGRSEPRAQREGRGGQERMAHERLRRRVGDPREPRPTGSRLVWKGTSTAEHQDVKILRHADAEGMVHIDFVYYVGENGNNSASDRRLFVKLGETGIEWVPKHVSNGRLYDGRCSGTL